jgi:hypothetical protein
MAHQADGRGLVDGPGGVERRDHRGKHPSDHFSRELTAHGRIGLEMAPDTDYSHRSAVQKLGVRPDDRVEVVGDVGPGLRRDVKEVSGRGLVRSGELDMAIVLVESIEEAEEAFDAYRPRMRDTGALWLITRKRGHESYLNQMLLVPGAKKRALIDNKTCSIDDERSGIRFVVPRALRKKASVDGDGNGAVATAARR